jgi:putative oxidoreductase
MADSTEARMLGFSLLMMRVVVGAIMLYYGVQDVFGLMGGRGFEQSSQFFADTFGLELYVGQIAMVAQLVAGGMLVLGFLTRYAAAIVGAVMFIGAVIGAKTTESLVKTTSADPLAAVGYPALIVVISIVLILLGGGLLSLDDRMKTKRRKAKVAQIS